MKSFDRKAFMKKHNKKYREEHPEYFKKYREKWRKDHPNYSKDYYYATKLKRLLE